MNTEKILRILAVLLTVGTIFTAAYTVATRGNAGASVILMVITLVVMALYREKRKAAKPGEE